jgi:hypothetical protein
VTAQRYSSPVALERMEQGRCPQCGYLPEEHYRGKGDQVAFCPLDVTAVDALVDQYRKDKEER